MDPTNIPENAPGGQAPAAPAGAPGQGEGGPAGGAAPTRDSLLAELPEGMRAGLSTAPDDALVAAHQAWKESGMLRSDYDRKRGTETAELEQLRGQLLHQQGVMEGMQGGREPATPPPTDAELMGQLLETSDPDEYKRVFDAAVGTRVSAGIEEALRNHPVLAQANMAMAAQRGRPEAMPQEVYKAGYDELLADMTSRGLDPTSVDPSVVEFLTPVWAERAALRAAQAAPPTPPAGAPNALGGGGIPPAAPTGAPAVTPMVPPVQGGVSMSTGRDESFVKSHGPDTTLSDRVKATLASMGMTPGDLRHLGRST